MGVKFNTKNQAACILEKIRAAVRMSRADVNRAVGVTAQDAYQFYKGNDMKFGIFQERVESMGYKLVCEETGCYRLNPDVFSEVISGAETNGKFYCVTDTEVIAAYIANGDVVKQTFPIENVCIKIEKEDYSIPDEAGAKDKAREFLSGF